MGRALPSSCRRGRSLGARVGSRAKGGHELSAKRPRRRLRRPPRAASDPDDASVVRHEEEGRVAKRDAEVGSVSARKRVETRHVEEVVPRRVEHFGEIERTPPGEEDSGEIETLPDGSVSIPILEEELVITKRTVVRERIIVRKRTETEQQRVEAELQRERVEVEGEGDADVADGT